MDKFKKKQKIKINHMKSTLYYPTYQKYNTCAKSDIKDSFYAIEIRKKKLFFLKKKNSSAMSTLFMKKRFPKYLFLYE